MTTVAERLVESWLDSQGERRYQPAFIQMLVSDGWKVLHNTRHSPIEIGKDVIARDPAGTLYCFQLKGNPGSRVTKNEAASLLSQFIELIELPPSREFRKSVNERHVAVFVTNGEIDEEARVVFNAAGERAGLPGVAASNYEIWTRGDMLSRLMPAIKVWPTTLDGTRLILELFTGTGDALPDPVKIGQIVESMMPTGDKISGPAKTAGLTSILVIAEVIKSRWYARDNHRALYMVSVLVSMALLRLADTKARRALVESYAQLAIEHARDLIKEADARDFDGERIWFENDPLGEFDIHWERRRLVADCAATVLLSGAAIEADLRTYAASLVSAVVRHPFLWGEGVLPSFIVAFWAMRRFDPTIEPERRAASLLRDYLAASLGEAPLPPAYYTFEDCWALYNNQPHATETGIFEDNFARRVGFARALMFLLAKRNLKLTCAQLWPLYTRVIHEEPELPAESFFTPVLCAEGKIAARTVRLGIWHDLVHEAVGPKTLPFLAGLESLDWLISAYISIVPYRAWSPVLMWLDARLAQTWYHHDHLPA